MSSSHEKLLEDRSQFAHLFTLRKNVFAALFGLFLFLVTMSSIVVSINSDVFKQFDHPSLEDYNFLNPLHVLEFSLDQLQYNINPNQVKSLETNSWDNGGIHYSFLIDVTGSIDENKAFKDSLILHGFKHDEYFTLGETETLHKLTSQSLLCLRMIYEILSNRSVPRPEKISVGFIRGVQGDPVSLIIREEDDVLEEIDNDLVVKFIEKDTIANRWDTDTKWTKIFESSFFKSLLPDQKNGNRHYMLTIISDFEPDKSLSIGNKNHLADIFQNYSDTLAKNDKGNNQLNLVKIQPSDNSIDEIIKDKLQHAVFFYTYDIEKREDCFNNLNEKISCIITPTISDVGISDQYLYMPLRSIEKQYLDYIRTYEGRFSLGKGRYLFKMISSETKPVSLKVTGKDFDVIDSNYKEIDIAEDETILLRQHELDPGYEFSKLDVFDVKNNKKTRFNLWQTEVLSKTGAIYYCMFLTTSSILLLTIVLLGFTSIFKLTSDFEGEVNGVLNRFTLSYILSLSILFSAHLFYTEWQHIYWFVFLPAGILLFILCPYDHYSIKEARRQQKIEEDVVRNLNKLIGGSDMRNFTRVSTDKHSKN